MISVIIPSYNEETDIQRCLESLFTQKNSDFEIIVVDDGSTDKTVSVVKKLKERHKELILINQDHKGPGEARNQGAKTAKGEILVFVDSDMTFDKNFLFELTKPIKEKLTKGTFTKNEHVSNWNNLWARCWNYNQGIKENLRIPKNYSNTAPVFRAILKNEFESVKGFDSIGYTDDWSLSRKLGYKASVVKGANCFHKNPETLCEIYQQARWIGKNEFISKGLRRYFNLIRYFAPISIVVGIMKAVIYQQPEFVIFKLVYNEGIFHSIIASFYTKNLYK